jgi:hypothetical protein
MMTRFKLILSVILVALFTTTCKERAKDEAVELRPSYELTTAVLGCLVNENQQAILVVDFLTEKKGEKNVDVASVGRLLTFNTQDISDIRTGVNSIFLSLESDSALKRKIPSKVFVEGLKKIPGYSSTKELNQQQLIALFKGGEVIVMKNESKPDFLIDFFSLFSSNAYAQQNDIKKIVLKFLYGLTQIPSCSISVEMPEPVELLIILGGIHDIDSPFGCDAGQEAIISATKELWNDIIAKSLLDVLNPSSSSSLQNIPGFFPPSEATSSNAGSWGDPHFTTFDGNYYDFQGVGEFQALKSTSDKLELQIRQQKYGNSDMVSVNTAIAFYTGGEKISFYLNPKRILINDAEFNLSSTERTLSNGGKLTREGDIFTIKNGTNDELKVTFTTDYLNYVITLNNNRKGKTIGLLGDFDGNVQNDIKVKNGSNVDVNDFKKFYSDFADSWRITQNESLFSYETGKNTGSYTDKNFPSKIYSISQADYYNAFKICTNAGVFKEPALSSCAYDVALTGNASWAKNYLSIQKDFKLRGPIAYYPFNNNANDESGNNNNGIIFGATPTADRKNKANSAFSFNGDNQFIRVPNSSLLHAIGQEITISAWVLVKEWQWGNWGSVACKATASKPHFQFQLYYDGQNATFATDGKLNNVSKFKMELNKWYHLVMMIDGKLRRYYVNGELIGVETGQPLIEPDYSPLEFGRDFYSVTENHIGSLDDIRIYNRILSNQEVKDLFKADN